VRTNSRPLLWDCGRIGAVDDMTLPVDPSRCEADGRPEDDDSVWAELFD
jgi:hypothetical protein